TGPITAQRGSGFGSYPGGVTLGPGEAVVGAPRPGAPGGVSGDSRGGALVLIFGVRPGVPQDSRRAGAADHGHRDPWPAGRAAAGRGGGPDLAVLARLLRSSGDPRRLLSEAVRESCLADWRSCGVDMSPP